jgi:hypothetical protein
MVYLKIIRNGKNIIDSVIKITSYEGIGSLHCWLLLSMMVFFIVFSLLNIQGEIFTRHKQATGAPGGLLYG